MISKKYRTQGIFAAATFFAALMCFSPSPWAQSGDVKPPVPLAGSEDDGSISSANNLPFFHGPLRLKATIGDGPHGSAGSGSGDYDWWAIQMNSGWTVSVDLDAGDALGSGLDPVVGIYDSTPTLVADNDDFADLDSYLEFTAPSGGTYYIVVRGWGVGWQADPFDSGSGGGAASEGDYIMTIAFHAVQP